MGPQQYLYFKVVLAGHQQAVAIDLNTPFQEIAGTNNNGQLFQSDHHLGWLGIGLQLMNFMPEIANNAPFPNP